MSTDDNTRPVFVSRKTAAALLEISVDTFDQWVQSGFVPAAAVSRGQITRWHWPTVEAALTHASAPVVQVVAKEDRDEPSETARRGAYPKGVFRTRKPNGTEYWYYQKDKGKPTRGPLVRLPDFGSPAFHEALRNIALAGSKPRYDIQALIADFKSGPQWSDKRPATIATYECALAPIARHWGSRDPGEITVSMVLDLMSEFADRPSMGNMVLVLVKKLMRLAVQRGHRTDNPTRDIDALFEDTDGAKPLTPAAWAALNAPECPVAVGRLAVLGRSTGQRISDLIRMRPIDGDEDGINCTITKLRDKPHWCILTAAEIAEIDGWGVDTATPYLMRPDGRRQTTDSMRGEWNDYLKTNAGAALAGFTPHDLRATKVCDERIAGKTHQQISAMVGMSLDMVMKYSRHIDQRLAARGGAPLNAPTRGRSEAQADYADAGGSEG